MKSRLDLVKLWIKKAENDLIVAETSAMIKPEMPADLICFRAQQCVEKHLKAYLIYRDEEIEKTHDLSELAALCARKAPEFNELIETVEKLTPVRGCREVSRRV